MRLLNNAWNSVSEVAIKCCFKKVNFTQPEESIEEQETEDTNNREIVKIWERLQAGGLIPKRYGFTNHSTSDKGLITHETITESSILSKLTVDEEEEEKEGDEDDKRNFYRRSSTCCPISNRCTGTNQETRSLPQKQ